ncbi:MAG: TIGR02281 family clan AA aspartic protease [Hyphomicrobium sp.]
MITWLIVAFLVLAAAFLLLRGESMLFSDLGSLETIFLGAAVAMIAVYVVVLVSGERARPLQAIRNFAVWGALALVLIALYSYREDISDIAHRVAGELAPPGYSLTMRSEQEGEHAVRVRRRLDGHFAVRGAINGQPMTLLVDTGASTVVLKPADAARAGIDTRSLGYTAAVQTANGTTYAAPVRLRSITIGPIELRDVEALVAKPGSINENLLGMSFLRRLRSYEFSKDFLTLRS